MFVLITTKSNHCFPVHTQRVTMDHGTCDHTHKNECVSLHSLYQLPVVSQYGVGTEECLSHLWLDLVWVFSR